MQTILKATDFTPVLPGDITVQGDGDYIVNIRLWQGNARVVRADAETSVHLEEARSLLAAWLRGENADLKLPLSLDVLSPFDRLVLATLRELPHGELITYGGLARAAGHPKAARAVGGAVGRNPFPVAIPCHRVVAKSGPGGFGGGMEWKRALLRIEGLELPL